MFVFLLLMTSYATKPPILNYSDYVIAYSPFKTNYQDIEKYMNDNDLTFFGVNIEMTPDVKRYYRNEYKDSQPRIYYFGKYLGLFDQFRKENEIQKNLKMKKVLRDENRKGKIRLRIKKLVHNDVLIYTNSREFADDKIGE